ncbi:CheY-like superfamily [Blyttiomyces helicus]|uniref:CheY-like superfamily n=1 Tax=Blyttiomyces helicus TaxID=388810 RepID=A0A4V1IPM3_9FUNG|nr:CheY-like superfamily [Blyttiomyces helicus]|eukprot:RKO83557.1 CheY-like superfamily [Blyttiomyces helicus]
MQADLASPIEIPGLVDVSSDCGAAEFADVSVLLAEDNPINRKVALRLLQKIKCTPDVVHNGMEALVSVRQRKYDLVLMSSKVTESLVFNIFTLALTASALPGDRETCIEAGMQDFVTKPFDLADLVRAFQRHCPRHSRSPPPLGLNPVLPLPVV